MAKGNLGGRRATTSVSVTTSTQQQVAQPQIDDTQQATAFDKSYQDFMAMSDDDKADFIEQTLTKGLPKHLADTGLQRFIYHSGMNDTPDVVTDAQLDKMGGTELFRTVNEFQDGVKRMQWTAPDIAEQLQYADVTRVGAGGGTVLGEGLYFADSFTHSQSGYGKYMNDINRTATIRGKLNSNAKLLGYSQAVQGVNQEMNSNTRLGQALRKADMDSRRALYALAKGYNVLYDDSPSRWRSSTYYVVLNRRAMTVSDTIKPMEGKQKW